MIRRPPRSTLFPTRRSSDLAAFYQERNRKWQRRSPFIAATLPELCRQIGVHTLFVGEVGAETEQTLRDIDRKSTRLNSSDANISYAVFCLKKKKKSYIHNHK